jgi:AraC family transcriptional regulator of adaptative response / DNA-3-methyladenine glycosylase II
LALKTRDARFDGQFFTGVTSTGIYCRPVCSVKAPRRENCRFFQHAAQAELAGFRPCLRCRPELAPQSLHWSTTDSVRILASEAAGWLDDPSHWHATGDTPLMITLAARMGVSDRHLRRVFEAVHGVSPLQYLQTRRLLSAKQLLADTDLPMTEVAQASGFASLRRFNAAFVSHYGLQPRQLRRPASAQKAVAGPSPVKLGYRPPYDQVALGRFMAQRAVQGLEVVQQGPDGLRLSRTLSLPVWGVSEEPAARVDGWLQVHWPNQAHWVHLHCSASLHPALPLLIRRVRQWLDLDADPAAIDAVLAPHFGALKGLRVPGGLDGFELAVRAILGQQISVAAARTLCQRVVNRFGRPLPVDAAPPCAGLSLCFPGPEAFAGPDQDPFKVARTLGELGVVKQRQRAVISVAQAVRTGQLALDGSADLAKTLSALTALPGIGDWTAQYLAMRALRWPDAFPAGDVVLQNALGTRQKQGTALANQRATEAISSAWRPWRSYAVLRLWEPDAPPHPISPAKVSP